MSVGGKVVRWGSLFLLALTALCAAYLYAVLHWSYSDGERTGYIQKFSRKGWIFKTWEGELAMFPVPGALPEKFLFTVRNEATARKINGAMGKKMTIVYEQHVGVPTTLFGDTQYYVVDVKASD